ncbi:hypothetical protein GH714_022502 [Hevea brasiliensis]|uniref:Uncharacterized protein n=1 Tax=Hevea brasiliensis TaxID=3981 RepID=A0A6A6LME4_HEVBR|nr:hypothetical protein GH714_022502 [Hevea brasiliensis]
MKDREARKSLETDLEDATKSLDEMNRNALILSGELEKANSRISNLEDEKEGFHPFHLYGDFSIPVAGYMLYLIERAKKCLDFSATLYVIHLFICIIYGGWPSSMTWWIVNGTGLAVMALLGEYLCIRRELREIPITRYRSIGIRVCGLRSVSKLSCFSQLGNDMEWPQKMEMVCQLWGDRACDTRKPSVYNCGWFLGKMLVVVLILFSGSVPYFNMNLDEFP